MKAREIVDAQMREHLDVAGRVASEMADEIESLAGLVLETLEAGGTLLFCGNGGSAADAQHLAAEYVVRFRRERRPMPALALTTDTSILTAAGNDFGFERVFERQVAALARSGDLLILQSTSGTSENLIRAARAARASGVRTFAMLARGGGPLASEVDGSFIAPTSSTARAQEMHLLVGHVVCEIVESRLGEPDS